MLAAFGAEYMSHDDILKRYIQSETAPKGDWRLNVPVGFSLEDNAQVTMGATKEIDALCITSRSSDPPKEYVFQHSGAELVNSDRLTQPRHYRNMWENNEFDGETMSIIEVKSNAPTLKGLGQLVGYRELLGGDWNIEIGSLVLV